MISVIIPLYNKEKIIERTLQSVLSQDYDDYELVIVDDGSTDKSVEIVKNLLNQLNLCDRVPLISQSNGGPSKARNTGVKNTKGEWIVFLDADDELQPGAMRKFAEAIAAHGDADILDFNKYNRYGTRDVLNRHTPTGYVRNPMKECFMFRLLPGCGSTVYRRSFFLNNLYNEKIRRFEDAELILRVLDNAKKIYSSIEPTMVHIADYAEASKPRKNVEEDYFAHLDFKTGGFWRRMSVYRSFLELRLYYPEYCEEHYSKMNKRYDWLIMFKVLNALKRWL